MKTISSSSSRAGTWVAAAILALVATTWAGDGDATTLLKLSVDRMSAEAAMVITGHVAWDYSTRQGEDSPVYTFTGVEVQTCVVGKCPETVTLKHRGGTVGDFTQVIPGMPRFLPGQRVLLFLRQDPEGEPDMYAVFGMVQGFFLVLPDPETNEKIAVQQLEGVTVAAPGPDGTIVPEDDARPVIMELEQLVAWIRAARAAAEKAGDK